MLFAVTLLLPSFATAELATGHYQFAVELAPLCLDGAYPFKVGNVENAICRLTTDSKGRLAGVVDMRAIKTDVTGKIAATGKGITFTLKGTDRKLAFRSRATLEGNRFVGTARAKGKVACEMDVTAAAELVTAYDLMLVVDSTGRVSGTGTATTCRQAIPVRVSGLTKTKHTTLRVRGANMTWIGSGASRDGGFTAKWMGRGFGAAMKGENLSVLAN